MMACPCRMSQARGRATQVIKDLIEALPFPAPLLEQIVKLVLVQLEILCSVMFVDSRISPIS